MICPVEIARDLSAFRAVRVRDHAKHGFLLEGRDGAGDESTGSDLTGDGKTDYLVAGGGDHRHQRPAHASLAGALPGVWLRRVVRSQTRNPVAETSSAGPGGAGTGTVSRKVFRSERAAFSREAAGGAPG